MLSDEQLLRYNRQILLHQFDVAGQEKLGAASVLVLGLGGLGSPAALYLAAAGVGTLVLADDDTVELSNLQRQLAHGLEDLGRNKAESAAATIAAINPHVSCRTVTGRLEGEALLAEVCSVDLVIDCSDNYPTRFALNRACISAAIPLVSAAAVGSEGQLAVFDPHLGGACYRCLYPREGASAALSCSDSGVLAPVVGVFGSLQAMEALKLLAGYGEPLRDTLLVMDLGSGQQQRLSLQPRQDCPDCRHLRQR